MKFAVFSLMQWPEGCSQRQVVHGEIEQLVEAEQQGYDAVWLAEHHFSRYGIGPAIHLTHEASRASQRRFIEKVAPSFA